MATPRPVLRKRPAPTWPDTQQSPLDIVKGVWKGMDPSTWPTNKTPPAKPKAPKKGI